MFAPISEKLRRKLWKHQAVALDFAIGNLNDPRSTTCLIRMPTGTGKTGIIACLTRLSNSGSSLVLTPWANLRAQMIGDLEKNFWDAVDLTPEKRKVVEMLPSNASVILKAVEPQVIVSTFTTLNEIRREYEAVYKQLSQAVTLVVADECHYEPAVEWGKSVKGLGVRTVLLTATPYRNDLKLFRISDPDALSHHFTHDEAVKRGIIRELAFDELPPVTDIGSLCAGFVTWWREAKKKRSFPVATPRAIICCGGALDIEATVRNLKKVGLTAIGVHDQFVNSSRTGLFKDVPSPKTEDAEVWVHQWKLTEGLDDHRFSCVALFRRIGNDRRLIQQIGRVLRRKPEDADKPAVLLAPPAFSVKAEWEAYLEFETDLRLLKPQHFRDVVDGLLATQPAVEYFDGKFRRRFAPGELAEKPQVIIPPSVTVRSMLKGFSLEDYIEACTDTLNIADAVILGPRWDSPCQRAEDFALWVYASVRNSRFLQSTSLYEITLETHCVVAAGGYVLIADSTGSVPREYLEERTAGVSQERLARFLDETFRPTFVSVSNSIPYDTVLRGADLHGHDLLNIATSLTDRIQICRAARGSSAKHGRRYIGMNTARLRKEETAEERRSFGPSRFVDWARGVADILNSSDVANSLFQRYMPTCEPPALPVPRTVCIDLLSANLDVTLTDGRECSLKTASSSVDVVAAHGANTFTCSFLVQAGKSKAEILSLGLTYDARKRRFWFTKDKGPAVRVVARGDQDSAAKGLAEFLNQNQEIVLVGLEGGTVVYQGRAFYRVDYSYAEQALLDLIKRPKGIGSWGTEKGTKEQIQAAKESQARNFPEDSLFRAIADGRIGFPFSDDVLICADLGTECADFLAASFKNQQFALIHAKVGSGLKISASAFHDIVAQAMKNLVYLTRNAPVPNGVRSWDSAGRWNGTAIPRVCRVPRGLAGRTALWNKVKSEVLADSNPQLFVVLVTAGCCDVDKLKEAVRDESKRTSETAQLLHLLDGLNGYARQLGVRLVIYDLPYKEAVANPPEI